MRSLIVSYLPWVLSVLTIATMFLAGSKWRWTWLLALGNQLLWAVWIVSSQSWGLVPMNAALWVVYLRNHLKWAS
jgi:hypothetical protein